MQVDYMCSTRPRFFKTLHFGGQVPKRKAASISMTEVQTFNVNGSTPYGNAAVNRLLKSESKPTAPQQTSKDDMQLVLQSFRLLIADLCQQFGMGSYHPSCTIWLWLMNDRSSRRRNWHGGLRRRTLEVLDALCSTLPRLVQPRQIHTVKR